MYGSHLSIAGWMVNALDEAAELGLDTVQVFTKNQQQWKAKSLDPGMVASWRTRVDGLGWQGRVVSHASYLINLASPDDELWAKSVDLMQDEIERCETLGIEILVHHPGAYTSSTPEAGLGRIAKAYKELFKRTRGYRTVSCLENTVGSGSNLGRTFEELAALRGMIIDATGVAERVGVCFDTCHAHAGGYDLSTQAGARGVLDELIQRLGPGTVRAVHLNDSKGKVGSRLDRHEHIGAGTIGLEGFRSVVNHPAFADKPKVLETPKDERDDGTAWDSVNLETLRGLMEGRSSDKASGKSPKSGGARSLKADQERTGGGKTGYPAPAKRGRKPRTGA